MVALLNSPRSEQSSDSYSLRFEPRDSDRRVFERRPASGEVLGHRIDHTLSARQNPKLNLRLNDLSLGGLAATADRTLEQGEHLSIRFPRRGLNPGWDACGRVIRCQPSALGYRIAIEFDSLLAA
jgi:hypothetical protein